MHPSTHKSAAEEPISFSSNSDGRYLQKIDEREQFKVRKINTQNKKYLLNSTFQNFRFFSRIIIYFIKGIPILCDIFFHGVQEVFSCQSCKFPSRWSSSDCPWLAWYSLVLNQYERCLDYVRSQEYWLFQQCRTVLCPPSGIQLFIFSRFILQNQ